ncbi:MAG: polysaccharide deacetylase family protein [Sulfurimonas sp.]|uniref:polysaccharide deacetylase family protein n=1 Tax=Sulfurimonas sp. TaxID=2022749 RepID=UPI0025EC780B|nr:polysaccharide deacetylase family protein [Sulfurimonas sp.]MCK9491110.1 polysaccharide deacetylase family protein [Sulfurimonas sp.]
MKFKKSFFISLVLYTSTLFADSSAVAFMYHRFDEAKYPSTNIKMEQFKEQLSYLKENNYNVWHLSKIISHIKDKKELPPKTIALTIDDAYISFYENGYPLLKEFGFAFSLMVSTNPIDVKSKNYMSWSQMREMQEHKAEFINHSVLHKYLIDKNKEEITKEILKAQKRLQDELGSSTNENPRLFSYPFGEYDQRVEAILEELDFIGITQTSGAIGFDTDLRRIPRFPMAEAYASMESFITKLNTKPMPIISVLPKDNLIEENNPPKLTITLKERLHNIQCFTSNGEKINHTWISQTQLEVVANEKLKQPRDKYTCTAPTMKNKWYWYSHLWIIK